MVIVMTKSIFSEILTYGKLMKEKTEILVLTESLVMHITFFCVHP